MNELKRMRVRLTLDFKTGTEPILTKIGLFGLRIEPINKLQLDFIWISFMFKIFEIVKVEKFDDFK